MDAKLTLKLNKDVIEKSKKYAKSHQKSLSRLVESYLKTVVNEDQKDDEIEISPFVKSFSTGVKIPSDYDYKKDFQDHLVEKYK